MGKWMKRPLNPHTQEAVGFFFSGGWGPRNLNDPICLGWVKVGDSDEIFDDPSHLPHRKNESATSRFPSSGNHGENKGYENLHVFFLKAMFLKL